MANILVPDMEPFLSPPDYSNKIPKPIDSSGKVYPVVRDELNAAIIEFRQKKAGKKG